MIPKTLLVKDWKGHVESLASIGHLAVGSTTRPLRVFLVNMDEGVQIWRNKFPCDLLFVYSNDKHIEGASVIRPNESFPFVKGTFDLVVYQDANDKILDELFTNELIGLLHKGGYAVVYKDWETVSDNMVKLFSSMPKKSRIKRIASYPANDGPDAPMVLVVQGAEA